MVEIRLSVPLGEGYKVGMLRMGDWCGSGRDRG